MRAGDKAFDERMMRSSGIYHAHEDLHFISIVMSIVEPGKYSDQDHAKAVKAFDEKLDGMIACPRGNLLVWDSEEE